MNWTLVGIEAVKNVYYPFVVPGYLTLCYELDPAVLQNPIIRFMANHSYRGRCRQFLWRFLLRRAPNLATPLDAVILVTR